MTSDGVLDILALYTIQYPARRHHSSPLDPLRPHTLRDKLTHMSAESLSHLSGLLDSPERTSQIASAITDKLGTLMMRADGHLADCDSRSSLEGKNTALRTHLFSQMRMLTRDVIQDSELSDSDKVRYANLLELLDFVTKRTACQNSSCPRAFSRICRIFRGGQ